MNFQSIRRWAIVTILTVVVAGCAANALDQTNEDLNSPAGGMIHIGDQLRTQNDNEGAIQFYMRAVQQAPSNVTARLRLAEAYEGQNNFAGAAEQYGVVAKIAPDNADARRAYGRVLVRLNRPADAKEQYEAALKIDSDDMRAINGLGVALDLLGNHEAAQQQYQAALEQKSDDPVTLSNYARSYIMMGAYGKAIALLDTQYKNPEASPVLRQNLADAYGLSGMDVDAERILKIDFPPDQVKKKITRYHALRAKISAPIPYAELGGFATPDLANAHIDELTKQFAPEFTGLAAGVKPEVTEEGGTPVFHIHVGGFKDLAAARVFCAKLRKKNQFCKPFAG